MATFVGEIIGLTLTNRWDLWPLATLVGAGIVCLFWLAARITLRPILRVIEETQEIARGSRAALGASGQGHEQSILTDSIEGILTQLRASQEAMSTFLADASHELKTPLTVIKGYVELMSEQLATRNELNPDFAGKALAKMSLEATRMQALIADLLFVAKVGDVKSGTMAQVNLSDLLMSELESLRDLQPERPLVLNVDSDVEVFGNKALLQQLLANIFSNLRRHTAASATARIALLGGATWVVLSINDAGPGLSDEAYETGVSHFKRFDKSRSRETGGTGLGMSIIQSIVERHGGRMRLSKSDLGGLRTRIWFPR